MSAPAENSWANGLWSWWSYILIIHLYAYGILTYVDSRMAFIVAKFIECRYHGAWSYGQATLYLCALTPLRGIW